MERIIKATRPEIATYEEYVKEIESIWDTGYMTNNGPKVKCLKETLSRFMGCQNLELYVNGHSALLIALTALGLPKCGEVLTSPFTFISTTNAIVQSGLTPVFCDIDETYNIAIESIRRNITPKVCAIVVPHIFGIPCHVEEIQNIAKEYNLKVIFDGAQAFGTKINGKNIGQFGDITMFSLHAVKIFNAIEGGILAYRDPELGPRLKLYKNFGIAYSSTNDVVIEGVNAKMTEFSAAMGLVNLPKLDSVIKRRKKLAEYYTEILNDINGIRTYSYESHIDYNYAYFPVIIDSEKAGKSRERIWSELKANGIETRKLYDVLTCDFSCYRNKNYRRDIKFATEIAKKCLDFPIYSSLTEEEINYIGKVLKKIVE